MKVLVGHPGRQHSFRLATAIKRAGVLEAYATTVYQGRRSATRILSRFLHGQAQERAAARVMRDLDDADVIQYGEILELLRLGVSRISSNGSLSYLLMRVTSQYFQLRCAAYAIRHRVDVVIMYDTNASTCFRILRWRAPQITRVIDHAHPCRYALRNVYQELMPSCGPFTDTLRERFISSEKIANRAGREVRLADHHIVASSFSKACALASGADEESVSVVPYGVELDKFRSSPRARDGKFRCLFVGEVGQRKGIYQLLQAAKALHNEGVAFTVIGGGFEYRRDLYLPYADVVDFRGRVSFPELQEAYRESDVFVFPALGEGYGQVLLEAMAAGLPVICTANCAGRDLVSDWGNGVIVEAGAYEPIVNAIRRLRDDRALLEEMSVKAQVTSTAYTWDAYGSAISTLLEHIQRGSVR